MRRYQEGALVTLALLNAAWDGRWLWVDLTMWETRRIRTYPYFCMADLPGVAGTEPITILRLIMRLNELMRNRQRPSPVIDHNFLSFFAGRYYFRKRLNWKRHFRRVEPGEYHPRVLEGFLEYFQRFRDARDFRVFPVPLSEQETREEAVYLKSVLSALGEGAFDSHPGAYSLWQGLDQLTRTYLIARACDLAVYCEAVANLSFPEPLVAGADRIVSALVSILEERERENRLKEREKTRLEEEKKGQEERARIEKYCTQELEKLPAPAPPMLPVRTVSAEARGGLVRACQTVLEECGQGALVPPFRTSLRLFE